MGTSNINNSLLLSSEDKKEPSAKEDQLNQLNEDSTEKALPAAGTNLSPQMQAEGESLTNELLQYFLQDLSAEGLDLLINR